MKTQGRDMLGVRNLVKAAIKLTTRLESKGWKSAVAGLAMVAGLSGNAVAGEFLPSHYSPAEFAAGRDPETVLFGIIRTQDGIKLVDPSYDFSASLKREWVVHKKDWDGTIFSNMGYGYSASLTDVGDTVFDNPKSPTKATLKASFKVGVNPASTSFVDKTVTALFVKEGSEWRMSDISYQDGTTFRSRLRGQK